MIIGPKLDHVNRPSELFNFRRTEYYCKILDNNSVIVSTRTYGTDTYASFSFCTCQSYVLKFHKIFKVTGDSFIIHKLEYYYTVLQKYAHIGLKQNLLRSITLDIITRLLDNAAFVCIHVVGRFSKEFSEVRGLRSRGFQLQVE